MFIGLWYQIGSTLCEIERVYKNESKFVSLKFCQQYIFQEMIRVFGREKVFLYSEKIVCGVRFSPCYVLEIFVSNTFFNK